MRVIDATAVILALSKDITIQYPTQGLNEALCPIDKINWPTEVQYDNVPVDADNTSLTTNTDLQTSSVTIFLLSMSMSLPGVATIMCAPLRMTSAASLVGTPPSN